MSSKTFKIRALVLRKTKLGEKDLIVTLLDESGALVKSVAKGARKPGGSLAARLEPFSTVDALMAKGRSLDVVCEARLVNAHETPRELDKAACAAPIAELLCLVAQPDLVQPRLFDMARSAFTRIALVAPDGSGAVVLCAATLWKIMAQSGFRPSFSTCVSCGRDISGEIGSNVTLSLVDGGLVCARCPHPADAIITSGDAIRWCEALIRSRFDEVLTFDMPLSAAFEVLHLARAWIRTHTGRDLKSLDFLFTSGLF